VDVQYKSQKENFAIVSLDESFILYDSLVRKIGIDENKRPVVRIAGSHKHSCLSGAIDIDTEGKQLCSQYVYSEAIHFLTF
jgi:hypothetical protein